MKMAEEVETKRTEELPISRSGRKIEDKVV
jgi:hypothetical protein